jgi:hypothetical protein
VTRDEFLDWLDPDPDEDGDQPWRGDVHLPSWPIELAGPEYWMWHEKLEDEVPDVQNSRDKWLEWEEMIYRNLRKDFFFDDDF